MKEFIRKYGAAGELCIHLVLLAVIGSCLWVTMHTENIQLITLCLFIVLSGIIVGGITDHYRNIIATEEQTFTVAGVTVIALPCSSDEQGCDKCSFHRNGVCTASNLMDSGQLPDCADTPDNHNSLGYRCYFKNADR